jgi:hypothetical protein
VLISAVNANSTPADIDNLVKAGASLVQTAHDNPAVITALANGGDLSKVLSTASGMADPVGMVQALASIGKAALTDSAGLDALLQGGGVSGLLNSLPSGTKLADVAAAVKEGGLAAGADVAKPPVVPTPPADTTPPPAPTVQLAQDTGASATDHITSNGKIQIGGIEAGAVWQYSVDAGKTWTTGQAADANGAATLDTAANGEQTLQVRAIDSAGNIGAATSFQYVLRTSLAPTMVFTVDGKEVPGLDTLSVNSTDYLVHIHGTTKGTVFDFQVSDTGAAGSWTTVKDTDPLSEGTHYIRYVATDLAGNVGATNALKLVSDQTAPSAPKVELVKDTGISATDHITSDGHIKISGLEANGNWEYSVDAGKTWTTGPAADANGAAILDTTVNGPQSLLVRSHDLARNTSEVTTFDYTLRTSLTPTMIFTVDGKEVPGLDTLSVNSTDYLVHILGTTKGTVFDFQVSDTGAAGSWTTVKDTDPLSEGTHYIRYVATDLAGNVGATNALKLVWDQTPPAAPKVELVTDSGISATDHFTNDGHVKVSGLEANGNWEYSFDAGKTWTTGPAADANGIAVLDTTANGPQSLLVRSHDLARNTSEVTSFDYTLQTNFKPTLAFRDGANGADLPGTTLLTNTDDFWITVHGGLNAAKVVFQVSDSGQDGTWHDADMAAPFSDGTHYIRDIVTDRAGNTGITNALRVDMDKTAPIAPTVALVNDSGISATDHITNDGHVKVSGLEASGSWEYSVDAGKTWTTGPAADANGIAILATTANGPQSLQVRSHDAAHNTSTVATLDYTLQTNFKPTLAFRDGANGADLPSTTLLTNTDDFWITLHGGLDAAKVVFQVSDSGQDGTWQDADMAAPFSDGTHYIRDIVTDRAGNTGITNALRVDMDKTPPPAPAAVELKTDTGVAGDGITQNGSFVVSGLAQGVLWQFSSDGKTWFQGGAVAADGTASGYAQLAGEQTLQVRTYDLAGNTSAPVSLHFTLDNNLPMLGLTLNGANPTSHVLHAAQAKTDLVFSYTGTIDAGDTFDYTPDFTGDATSTWIKIDSTQIDTVNKTITIRDFDLSSADAFLTLRGADLAGNIHYQASIDGPYTSYFTQTSAAGLKFLLNGQPAHLYLTDGSNPPVQVKTLDASGDLVSGQNGTMIGAQSAAVKGVLGVGSDAAVQTVNDKAAIYAFGTTAGDTLSGNDVWGFGGNDTITATGSDKYNSAWISGGAGADVIHTETSSSQLMYASSAESSLVADEAVAHGFDTVYISNGAATQFTDVLNLEDIKLGDFYKPVGAASFSGSETGNALLALLNTAVGTSFKTGLALSQAALVSFGNDTSGHNVNFLVVDADKDGHVTSADYVIKIVGSIGMASVTYDNGMVFLNTSVIPL